MSKDVEYRDILRSKIIARLRELDGLEVKVGVQGTSGLRRKDVRRLRRTKTGKKTKSKGKRRGRIHRGAGKATVVDIATIHEWGSPKAGIPARSFLRTGIENGKPHIHAIMRRAWKKASRGDDPSKLVERVGVVARASVQRALVEVRDPPLAKSTKRRRFLLTGDSDPNPLIDTGQLKNSITYVVFRPTLLQRIFRRG